MTEHLTVADLLDRRGGDRITIPDGWTLPANALARLTAGGREEVEPIAPGWTLTHDGGPDSIPWGLRKPHERYANFYLADIDVEALRIPRDAADWIDTDAEAAAAVIDALDALPEGAEAVLDPPRTIREGFDDCGIGHSNPIAKVVRSGRGRLEGNDNAARYTIYAASGAVLGGFSEQVAGLGLTADDFRVPAPAQAFSPDADDEPRERFAHVHVAFDGTGQEQEVDDDGAPLRACPDDECTCNPSEGDDLVPVETKEHQAVRDVVATDQRPLLDEWQLERVAALEHSLRVLESRRGPSGGQTGAFQMIAGKPHEVPMVKPRDLIDVAAFIADGDTGRTEVSA